MITRRLSPLIVALAMGLTVGVPTASAQALYSSHTVLASLPANGRPDPGHKKPPPHTCDSGKSGDHRQDPKCQAPEAPLAIGLPLTALVIFGGYVMLVRRRDDRDVPAVTIPS